MDAEPRYAIETLDRVLRAMGCRGGKQPNGAWTWRSPNESRPGHISFFSYTPDRACKWIRHEYAVLGALRLQKEPHEVIRRLREAGGEVLDP